jgi:UDP-glucose 4-epimerase
MKAQGILILGGTGFVGRQLLKRLHPQHPEIYVIARSSHTLPTLSGVHCYTDSLDNLALLNTILPHCKTVIHLASDSTPGSSALQPTFEATNNLLPTLRFLEILQKYEHVSLIYTSSGGAIYGNPTAQLVKENDPLAPLSYYGAGKAALEKFIMAFCQQSQHHAIILRPTNFYGPEQPYRKGFGVIPTIFQTILTKKPLQIWGDGENVRDYLYISDFIDLCIQLIDEPVAHNNIRGSSFFTEKTLTSNSIYNVGSEQGTTLNQLCSLIEEMTQMPVIRQYKDARAVDVKRIVLDCSRLHEDYHWYPRIDLKTGLTKTWKWFNTH